MSTRVLLMDLKRVELDFDSPQLNNYNVMTILSLLPTKKGSLTDQINYILVN